MAAVPQLVETVTDLSELATLSMQAMVIFNDFDDKVIAKDGLLQRMNLTKARVDTTLQDLQDILDAAHRVRDQASEDVVRQVMMVVLRPDNGDDGEKPKALGPEVEDDDGLKPKALGPEVEDDDGLKPALGPEVEDDGVKPALGPEVEDDGVKPALGPEVEDDGVKPKALAPELSWKDMESWWEREEEAKETQ